MKSLHHLAAVAGVLALAAMPVKADLLTSPAQLPSAPVNLLFTFDSPDGFNLVAPVAIGNGVTFSTTGGPGSLGDAGGIWSLGSNGFWSLGKTFAGVDGDFDGNGVPAGMLFDFGGLLVKGVGGFMNFDPDFTFGGPTVAFPLPLYIAAFDRSGALLEDYELPLINTPGEFNAGVFYGIGRDQADIASFLISGPYAVVDDLQIAAIPLPPTAWLMGAGMLLLGWQARRRKQA